MISWSSTPCAVQYVAIINSTQFLNMITTTDDNGVVVGIPRGAEFCVTVLGVDSIGRRRDSTPLYCYTNCELVITMFCIPLVCAMSILRSL